MNTIFKIVGEIFANKRPFLFKVISAFYIEEQPLMKIVVRALPSKGEYEAQVFRNDDKFEIPARVILYSFLLHLNAAEIV